MANTAVPAFTQTPICSTVQIATANTNRDGTTGTYGTLRSAGSNGDLIDCIVIQAAGTTTAGVVRLFIDNGTNVRLLDEILVTAITPSATIRAFRYAWTPDGGVPLMLPNGYSIKCSTHNAESINLFAIGGAL